MTPEAMELHAIKLQKEIAEAKARTDAMVDADNARPAGAPDLLSPPAKTLILQIRSRLRFCERAAEQLKELQRT